MILNTFFKQHFYKQSQADIGKKIKQMLCNTLQLGFCYMKIIHVLHPRYHPKIIGHILKNMQKNKCICVHEIIRLTIMKMKIKMKNRSHRHDINRPRLRPGHKNTKYRKFLNMMMLICIKQHLSNICTSIHEKVKQHGGWVKKSVAYKNGVYSNYIHRYCVYYTA